MHGHIHARFCSPSNGTHSCRVQGAQSAAKVYVWAFLTGLHGVLSFTQGGVCVSSLMFVLLLGAGGFCFWAGERDY